MIFAGHNLALIILSQSSPNNTSSLSCSKTRRGILIAFPLTFIVIFTVISTPSFKLLTAFLILSLKSFIFHLYLLYWFNENIGDVDQLSKNRRLGISSTVDFLGVSWDNTYSKLVSYFFLNDSTTLAVFIAIDWSWWDRTYYEGVWNNLSLLKVWTAILKVSHSWLTQI